MKKDEALRVGKRVRKYRKASELSQAALAKKAGVATNTVARSEQGENVPNTQTLKKLANVLGVSIGDLAD